MKEKMLDGTGGKEYRSIKNMETIIGETREVEYVGTWECESGRRRFLFYEDKEGMGWYETQIFSDGKWRSEEEAIFGRKISGRAQRKSRRL